MLSHKKLSCNENVTLVIGTMESNLSILTEITYNCKKKMHSLKLGGCLTYMHVNIQQSSNSLGVLIHRALKYSSKFIFQHHFYPDLQLSFSLECPSSGSTSSHTEQAIMWSNVAESANHPKVRRPRRWAQWYLLWNPTGECQTLSLRHWCNKKLHPSFSSGSVVLGCNLL